MENFVMRNFSTVLFSPGFNNRHLWRYKFILYYWLLPATTFNLVFATSLKYRAHFRRVLKRDLFRNNTHFYEIEAEHLFHIYLSK